MKIKFNIRLKKFKNGIENKMKNKIENKLKKN